MDKYQSLREMPFTVIAQALGIDLSKFRQRKGGSEWSGPCPVHAPKKNQTSFSYAADGKQNCFSCGHHGRGGIDLVMAVRGVGFQAAVELLEPYAGSVATHQGSRPARPALSPPISDIVTPAENKPFKSTYEKFFRPHPWLAGRGLEPSTLERFGVGFYENPARRSVYNGSVMLKIRRWSDGETVGYLSRNVGEITPEKPKYRFAEGFQKQLEVWGSAELREDHQLPVRVLYIVESAFACMHFYQLGIPAVALMGWTVSGQQADIIAQLAKGCVVLVDRNKQEDIAPYIRLLSKKLWVKAPELPDGVDDPERLTVQQIKDLT